MSSATSVVSLRVPRTLRGMIAGTGHVGRPRVLLPGVVDLGKRMLGTCGVFWCRRSG